MKTELIFDDYLYLDLPTPADIAKAEAQLKVKFPPSYTKILLAGAGKSAENQEPVTSSGRALGFRCFNHIDLASDEPHKVNVSALDAWRYGNKLLEIADNGGGTRYCLDYRTEQNNPPVVVVYAWGEGGDEKAVELLADNFEAFIGKFTV